MTAEGFAVRKYIPYVNSFQPVATGRFEPSGSGGTRVPVDFSLAASVRLTIGATRAVAALIAAATVLLLALALVVPGSVAFGGSVVVPLAAVAILAAVGATLRNAARQTTGEDEFLLRVLEETLQAKEASGPAAGGDPSGRH